ncbi:MAG: hypothetical protein Q8Q49_02835 [bacterium]|nr:hypothetical protein [bacterium]
MADAETGKPLLQATNPELLPQITSHPVTAVLDAHAEQIRAINGAVSIIPESGVRQQYLGENLGFLADAIEGIESFSLTQEAIEEIWRKADELEGGRYFKYSLVGMIGFSYLLQGLPDRDELKGSTAEFVRTWDIPDERDEDGRDRRILRERYGGIHSIFLGLTPSMKDELNVKAVKFHLRKYDGDTPTEEERVFEEECARFDAEREFLGDILENFANGFNMPINFALGGSGESSRTTEGQLE